MNIHEHQAKGLLKKFGVSVPDGYPAFTVEEAVNNAKKLPGPVYVVKAQIHAGGRGKAGGVKVVKNIEEVEKASEEILGKVLVTPQTGSKGKKVQRLYIEDGCQIDKEFYFSILVDRNAGCISIISSTEGGVNIEEVAEKTPEKIIKVTVDPKGGFMPFHARIIANGLKLSGDAFKQSYSFFSKIYKTFVDLDASLVEINPLVLSKENKLIALDAKMSFDHQGVGGGHPPQIRRLLLHGFDLLPGRQSRLGFDSSCRQLPGLFHFGAVFGVGHEAVARQQVG